MADPAARQLSALRGFALGTLGLLACSQEHASVSMGAAVPADPIGMPAMATAPPAMPASNAGTPAPTVLPMVMDASVGAVDAGPAPHLTRVSLIDHALWTQVGSAEDPFADRPADVRCPESAAAAELLSEQPAFGVDTGLCNYLTVRQLIRDDVAAGETIDVRLWHFELDAPNPGEAHAAVDVGGVRVLDQRIAIPADGGLVKASLPIDHAVPAGSPVYFHLHNHGANSWALIEITTGPAP